MRLPFDGVLIIVAVGNIGFGAGVEACSAVDNAPSFRVDIDDGIKVRICTNKTLKIFEHIVVCFCLDGRKACDGGDVILVYGEPSLERHRLHIQRVRDIPLNSPRGLVEIVHSYEHRKDDHCNCKKKRIKVEHAANTS